MKKNGLIKTFIIISLVILSEIFGNGPNTHYPIIIAIVPSFFFGMVLSLIVGFVASYVKNIMVMKPQWNDSILSFRKPLSIIQFLSFMLITIGIVQQLSQWLTNNDFRQVGILIGTLGVGLLSGIWLTIKLKKNVGNST